MELSKDMLGKAKEAKSPEQLSALAKENGVELTAEEAEEYFAQMHKEGELSDEELDHVSGGGCHKKDGRLIVTTRYGCDLWACTYCGSTKVYNSLSGGQQMHCCISPTPVLNPGTCSSCKFMSYEKGLWLCNHPENTK